MSNDSVFMPTSFISVGNTESFSCPGLETLFEIGALFLDLFKFEDVLFPKLEISIDLGAASPLGSHSSSFSLH